MLVACEANKLLKEETEDMIKTPFETMKQKPFIKIILTTQSEDRTVHFLQHGQGNIWKCVCYKR